jgi:hypothetical protein
MKTFVGTLLAALLVAVVANAAWGAPKQAGTKSAAVKRGEYLVTLGGCNDCHTPFKMGPNGPVMGPKGPEKDTSRLLSGHPETLELPAPPEPKGPWIAAATGTFTAWAGPWGVSFTTNLTPDEETGLGKWTVQNFIEAMRTGRHQGRGRPILPPMPWQDFSKMTDGDLQAVFAYLRTIAPIRNHVPDPIPPAAAPSQAGAPGAGTPGTGSGTPPAEPPPGPPTR